MYILFIVLFWSQKNRVISVDSWSYWQKNLTIYTEQFLELKGIEQDRKLKILEATGRAEKKQEQSYAFIC